MKATGEELSVDAWDATVRAHPDCTAFHLAAWAGVIAATYGHRFLPLRLRSDEGEALVPMIEIDSWITGRRGLCLPFTDVCPPLLTGAKSFASFKGGLQAFARERGWGHAEFRGGIPAEPDFFGHEIDLSVGAEELETRLAAANRRSIRKARRSGVTVQFAATRRAMLDYYRLHLLTRQRHGVPPQPFGFFENIAQSIMERGHGFVVTAIFAGEPIAAAVFLRHHQHAIYKFAASDERWRELRGNHLVLREAILALANTGATTLHLGRTDVGHDGLRRFKRSWGAMESPIAYVRLPGLDAAPAARRHGGLSGHLFRALPPRVNRVAGQLLYPHLD